MFAEALKKEKINVLYRKSKGGKIYGITFIDRKAKVVFNGSSLSKNYSAGRIFSRMGSAGRQEQQARNRNERYVYKVLIEIDFRKGFASVLAGLYAKGIQIRIAQEEEGGMQYMLGYYESAPQSFVPADKKIAAYLQINGYTKDLSERINSFDHSKKDFSFNQSFSNQTVTSELEKQIKTWLQAQEAYEAIDYFRYKKKRRKRKKSKPN